VEIFIKWLVPENPEEQDVPQALALLDALKNGNIAAGDSHPPCFE